MKLHTYIAAITPKSNPYVIYEWFLSSDMIDIVGKIAHHWIMENGVSSKVIFAIIQGLELLY